MDAVGSSSAGNEKEEEQIELTDRYQPLSPPRGGGEEATSNGQREKNAVPKSVVRKIARKAAPPSSLLSRQAVEVLAQAVPLFVTALTRASHAKTLEAGRKTLSKEDILHSRGQQSFLDHLQPLSRPPTRFDASSLPQLQSEVPLLPLSLVRRAALEPARATSRLSPAALLAVSKAAELFLKHLVQQASGLASAVPMSSSQQTRAWKLSRDHVERAMIILHPLTSSSSSSSSSSATDQSWYPKSQLHSSSSTSATPISSSSSSPSSSSTTPTPISSTKKHRKSKHHHGPEASLLVAPSAREDLAGFEPLGPPELFEAPCGMTPQQQLTIDNENIWRQLFAQDPNSSIISDPHLGLTSVFDNVERFKFAQEDADERSQPKILTFWRPDFAALEGKPSIVDQATFMRRWTEFTHGAFEGMCWDGVFAAGGAPLSCVIPHEEVTRSFESSDIDLFIYGCKTDEEANQKARHVYSVVKQNSGGKRDHLVRTKRTITILGDYPMRHIQIILRLYRNPAEVLLGFDLDSCGIGFDGEKAWATVRFQEAINKGYNLLNPTRFSLTTEIRLEKYARRGFAVVIPDLDKRRVDPAVFKRTFKKSRGLSRLLLYERNARKQIFLQATNQEGAGNAASAAASSSAGEFDGKRSEFEHAAKAQPSDYDDVHIPWGPKWVVDNILKMLNIKDRRQFFGGSHRRPSDTKTRANQQGKHSHLFVAGIDGVLDGHSFWCRLCHKPRDSVHKGVPTPGSKSGSYLKGQPIEWLKDCPSYQDYERGFRRKLLTGSFFPVLSADFNKGVYLDEIRDQSKQLFSSHPIAESLFDCPPHLHSITDSPASVLERVSSCRFSCPSCQAVFISRNMLYAHISTVVNDPPHFQAALASIPLARPKTVVAESSAAPKPRFRHPPKRANSGEGIGYGIGRWKISRFALAAQKLAASTKYRSNLPTETNSSKNTFSASTSSTPTSSTPTSSTPTSSTSTSSTPNSSTSRLNRNKTQRAAPQLRVPDPARTIRMNRFVNRLVHSDPYIGKICSVLEPLPRALVVLSMLRHRQAIPDDEALVLQLKTLILTNNPIVFSSIEVFMLDFDLVELSDTLTQLVRQHSHTQTSSDLS